MGYASNMANVRLQQYWSVYHYCYYQLQLWLNRCDLIIILFLRNCSTHNLTAFSHRAAGKPTPVWFSSGWTHQTLPSIPSPPITKSARKDVHAHVGGMAHTCMHMVRAHAHRIKPMHSQVLSGLTLNKWSIHLSSQKVASINRCCLMFHSSITAGSEMSYNF